MRFECRLRHRNSSLCSLPASGRTTPLAGTGEFGCGGDGGPASEALHWDPDGVAVNAASNVYLVDKSHRVRAVSWF